MEENVKSDRKRIMEKEEVEMLVSPDDKRHCVLPKDTTLIYHRCNCIFVRNGPKTALKISGSRLFSSIQRPEKYSNQIAIVFDDKTSLNIENVELKED